MGNIRRWIARASLTLCAAVASSEKADASPITYTQTTTASGTLGTASFAAAKVTFTQTAEQDDVFEGATAGHSGRFLLSPSLTSTVNIEGLGSAALTEQTGTYSFGPNFGTGNFAAGVQVIGAGSGAIYLGARDAAMMSTYDLTGSWDPIVADTVANLSLSIPTDRGALIFSSISQNTTFAARVDLQAAPVPEPSSLILHGIVLIGLGVWTRRSRTA